MSPMWTLLSPCLPPRLLLLILKTTRSCVPPPHPWILRLLQRALRFLLDETINSWSRCASDTLRSSFMLR